MKLDTNIHHVSMYCCKCFQGQRSKVKVMCACYMGRRQCIHFDSVVSRLNYCFNLIRRSRTKPNPKPRTWLSLSTKARLRIFALWSRPRTIAFPVIC